MASSLTNKGQEIMLKGTVTPNGSIANLATALLLYDSTSVPDKDGTGFVEVANGGGYTTGGIAITTADWTLSLVGSDNQIELGDQAYGPRQLGGRRHGYRASADHRTDLISLAGIARVVLAARVSASLIIGEPHG